MVLLVARAARVSSNDPSVSNWAISAEAAKIARSQNTIGIGVSIAVCRSV